MCHASEYIRTNSTIDAPVDGAWLDYSAGLQTGTSGTFTTASCATVEIGRSTSRATYGNCYNWTRATDAYTGLTVTPEIVTTSGKGCDVARPIACCL